MRALLLIGCMVAPLASADDLFVSHPFATQTARDNFNKCFPTEKKTLDGMEKIARIAYSSEHYVGCPPKFAPCREGVSYFIPIRHTFISSPLLDPSNAEHMARQIEGGDCSFTALKEFSGNVTRKQAVYTYAFKHTDRECILGVKTDTCHYYAKMRTTMSLSDDFKVVPSTEKLDDDGDCFGVPSSWLGAISSPLGSGLNGLYVAPLALLTKQEFSTPSDARFLGLDINLNKRQLATIDQIANAVAVEYELAPERSGFEKVEDEYAVEIVQTATYDDAFQADWLAHRHREIEFLRDLGQVAPKTIILGKGDSLWKLSQRAYGEPELFLVIEQANLKRGEEMRAGDSIRLPYWHEMCEQLKKDPLFVRQNESVWTKFKAGQLDKFDPHLKTRSGNADVIYPFEHLLNK